MMFSKNSLVTAYENACVTLRTNRALISTPANWTRRYYIVCSVESTHMPLNHLRQVETR